MKQKKLPKCTIKQKVCFSTIDTVDAWTGGGYFEIKWQLDIFNWRICIWKQHK